MRRVLAADGVTLHLAVPDAARTLCSRLVHDDVETAADDMPRCGVCVRRDPRGGVPASVPARRIRSVRRRIR